ncbi:hypothetical protein [Novacetimonas pomaceti]|uniref:hypothetical protein n=1 Tax=Novacetimonas pomaceti TaxID=2021998 RepID=UPI001C2DCF91|nr:hypothetical protein [Novacetimonas pomaceti]MBV1834780.1 hypothetical protein [Novacetimonas pomaceti]
MLFPVHDAIMVAAQRCAATSVFAICIGGGENRRDRSTQARAHLMGQPFRHRPAAGALTLFMGSVLITGASVLSSPHARAASEIPGLGEYAQFGMSVTGNGTFGRCTVRVSFDAGRFSSSARVLDSMGILDNVDATMLRRRTNYYMRVTAEELAPIVVDHAFQRFGHSDLCHFEFASQDSWMYGGGQKTIFMKFVITGRTATQVDWYKASFDELHEVASGFWEDAEFTGPAPTDPAQGEETPYGHRGLAGSDPLLGTRP